MYFTNEFNLFHSTVFVNYGWINRDGDVSESEGEDNTETVGVSQKMGVKVSKGLEEVGVKLVELGPRIKMQVI